MSFARIKTITILLTASTILPVNEAFSQLAPYADTKQHISPIATPAAKRGHSGNSGHRDNELVLFEDFESATPPSLPDGWSGGELVEQQQDNNNGTGLGTFVAPWRTGNALAANNGGYLPVPDIAGNRFAYANDDGDPCNCDMMDVGLVTPEMDFTGLENMILTLDAYSQAAFGGSNLQVQISTNGTDFITLTTASSSPEWQSMVIDLSLFDDEPSVWLRFAWSDNGAWSTGTAVDNIMVAENYAYNAAILRAHTAEVSAPFDDTSVISGEYSQIPIEQAAAITPGARVVNKGSQPIENLILNAEISLDGNVLGSYNSQVFDILYPFQQTNIYVYTDLIPSTAGVYEINYELISAQDEDLSDNTGFRTINYVTDIYALDDGTADSFRDNSGLSFTIGNRFEIANEGSICHSIGIGIGSPSVPFSQIFARIYDSNYLFVAGSAPYVIQAGDMTPLGGQNLINIPLSTPVELQGGTDYIAAVSYFANPAWQFAVANSGSSQEQFSVFQDQFGDWFFTTTTPMIRMNLSPSVSLPQEVTSVENLSIFPNPVSSGYELTIPAANNGQVMVELLDLSGRIIDRQNIEVSEGQRIFSPVPVSHMPAGLYLISLTGESGRHTARLIKK
jgi:hypothetical protein